jgi:fucose permease
MARWTLLGAIGVTAGPLLMTVLFSFGIAWRGTYVALAVIAALFAVALFQQRFDSHDGAHAEPQAVRVLARSLLNALRQRSLLKWVLLTELADFMLDKLLEVTGLYFHDVAGVSLAGASAAVAVSTVAGLIGSALLVPVLERQTGVRVLRASAVVVLLAYVLFLVVSVIWLKYVLIGVISFGTSSWFAILRAKTFEALPGQSGLVVAVTSLANISSLFVPLLLGGLADAVGLQSAMWLLALGPVALIIGLR